MLWKDVKEILLAGIQLLTALFLFRKAGLELKKVREADRKRPSRTR